MAKFKYSMQNILEIKMKLETQAKNEFSIANRKYQTEKDRLDELVLKRVGYETRLKESFKYKQFEKGYKFYQISDQDPAFQCEKSRG